jgi:hypothetical protein
MSWKSNEIERVNALFINPLAEKSGQTIQKLDV